MARLTWRAVLIGSSLGGVLSLINLYIGGETSVHPLGARELRALRRLQR